MGGGAHPGLGAVGIQALCLCQRLAPAVVGGYLPAQPAQTVRLFDDITAGAVVFYRVMIAAGLGGGAGGILGGGHHCPDAVAETVVVIGGLVFKPGIIRFQGLALEQSLDGAGGVVAEPGGTGTGLVPPLPGHLGLTETAVLWKSYNPDCAGKKGR